jgi:hypothetical protein
MTTQVPWPVCPNVNWQGEFEINTVWVRANAQVQGSDGRPGIYVTLADPDEAKLLRSVDGLQDLLQEMIYSKDAPVDLGYQGVIVRMSDGTQTKAVDYYPSVNLDQRTTLSPASAAAELLAMKVGKHGETLGSFMEQALVVELIPSAMIPVGKGQLEDLMAHQEQFLSPYRLKDGTQGFAPTTLYGFGGDAGVMFHKISRESGPCLAARALPSRNTRPRPAPGPAAGA